MFHNTNKAIKRQGRWLSVNSQHLEQQTCLKTALVDQLDWIGYRLSVVLSATRTTLKHYIRC